jgi:tetratricopeptide (TPR) repeat protein
MLQHPWALWNADGTPRPGTAELVATLEAVLRRYPNHVGANHYYIHAVEASANPERATPSAERLAQLAPSAGHLVHMPAHIYLRTGRYHESSEANERAIKADDAFLQATGESGVYILMYYSHNLQFLCYSQMMEGRERDSMRSARELERHVPLAIVRQIPMAEYLVPMPLIVEARFGKLNQILREPAPPADLKFAHAFWTYARGLAFSAQGNFAAADRERTALNDAIATIPADAALGSTNNTRQVLEVAVAVLDGEISAARGLHAEAATKFAHAVALADQLNYDEPPVWYYPPRESLGQELLAAGQPARAEAVYREDLKRNPYNPRSLFGLALALRTENRGAQAAAAEARFKQQWRYADVDLEPDSSQAMN